MCVRKCKAPFKELQYINPMQATVSSDEQCSVFQSRKKQKHTGINCFEVSETSSHGFYILFRSVLMFDSSLNAETSLQSLFLTFRGLSDDDDEIILPIIDGSI